MPAGLDRLSLTAGSDLVVRIGASAPVPAAPAAPKPFAAATPAASAAALRAAPPSSTEFLERRALLETLSATEAAAVQAARPGGFAADAPLPPAPRLVSRTPVRRPAAPSSPAPFWLGLAFLPAAAFLLKEVV
ncbi:MAG: hypothetical protein HY079_03665 [Elusimicrobia bacterium]|nr:hypothetical protein [Elusimicrobiota bacterium]